MDNWNRYRCESLLGGSMVGQKRYPEAEPLLVSAYQALNDRKLVIPAPNRPEISNAGTRILQLYRNWGKPEELAKWSRSLQVVE